MPTLLIVVDEFSELLAAKPEFLDLLITMGRVGRSLGVHLLLAAQRLEEGRLRRPGHLPVVPDRAEDVLDDQSRIVLGAPDAFELPTAPGNGYLKFDGAGLVRFKSAYVSGPVRGPRMGSADHGWVDAASLQADRGAPPTSSRVRSRPGSAAADRGPGQSLLEVAVSRLAGSGVPAHEVWLPPLKEPPSLDLLLPRGSVRAVPVAADPGQRAPRRPHRPPSCRCRSAGWTSPTPRPAAC